MKNAFILRIAQITLLITVGFGSTIAKCAESSGTATNNYEIDFVYMGGNDCPPCVRWRGLELPKLMAMPEYGMLRFTYVPKVIGSQVPEASYFPSELRYLRNPIFSASGGVAGSPMNAILVNGKVIEFWRGARDAEVIAQQIRVIRARFKMAGSATSAHPQPGAARAFSGQRRVA